MAEFDAGTVKATMTADTSGSHAAVEKVKKDYKDLAQAIADAMRIVKNEERQANQVEKERQRELQETARKARETAQAEKQAIQDRKEGYQTLALVSGGAFTAIVMGIKKATEENIKLKSSMTGLDSVAVGNLGTYDKIKAKLQEVQSDGMIPLTNATAAFKNLISRYKDEDVAINMFDRLSNSAAFNRQAHLSLGDAIQGATEGLKNEMSQLVDNAGVTENVSQMWAKYAASIGKGAMSLTLAEKRQAEINGVMEATKFQVGDLVKLQGQLSGQMAKASAETIMTAAALGGALEPAISTVVGGFAGLMKGVKEFIQENPGLVAGITTAALATTGLVAATSAWIALDIGIKIAAGFSALAGPVGIAMIALSALAAVFVGLETSAANARAENDKFYGSLRSKADDVGGKAVVLNDLIKRYDDLKEKAKTSKTAQQELQDVVKQISQIAPDAVTQWDNLGNAIGISGEKANEALKNMLKARKDMLEVSLAREKSLSPGYKATISNAEAPNSSFQLTKKEVDTAQTELQKLYDKYSGYRQWFLTYFAADQATQKNMIQEGLDKNYIDDTGNVLGSYYAIDDKIQKAETRVRTTSKRFEDIGKSYYDAKQKLAENAANIAELQTIVDKGAGLDTVKPRKTNTDPIIPKKPKKDEDNSPEKQAELLLKLQAETQARIRVTKQVAIDEEEIRYQDERRIAELNAALIEEVEKGHVSRLSEIDFEYRQKEQQEAAQRIETYKQDVMNRYSLEQNLTDWEKQELLKRMNNELDALLATKGASQERIEALQAVILDLSNSMPDMTRQTAEWSQSLIDGMAGAIARGESLNDVFRNLLQTIAEWVLKNKILMPLLGGMFGGLSGGGLPGTTSFTGMTSMHSGGAITASLWTPVRAHTGMIVGDLKSDERPIITQVGEQILNRQETQAYNAGKNAAGGGGAVSVNVVNNSSQPVNAKTETSYDIEKRVIKVVLTDLDRNGELGKRIKRK